MKSAPRRTLLAACLATLAALTTLAAPLAAQAQAYPAKPIKIVVPYPPGGGTDILGRLVAAKLQEAWSQPVTVENKTGASGVLGNDMVAKSAPDGYTVLLAITAIVQSPALMKLPYDPYKDLLPVSQLATSSSMLAVRADMPVNTVAEYVALVKSQPGKHAYGSYGNGTSSHIQGENFKHLTKTDLAHVPYKGSAPMLNDLLGGQLSSAFVDASSGRSFIVSGKLKVLASTGTERQDLAPKAPTFHELNMPGFEPRGWFGFFLPAGTPAAVVAKLSGELQRITKQPDVVKRIDDLGLDPVGSTPEAFGAVVKKDGALYAKLIKDLNIRVD